MKFANLVNVDINKDLVELGTLVELNGFIDFCHKCGDHEVNPMELSKTEHLLLTKMSMITLLEGYVDELKESLTKGVKMLLNEN